VSARRGWVNGFRIISASEGGYGTLIREHDNLGGNFYQCEGVANGLSVAVCADFVCFVGRGAGAKSLGTAASACAEYSKAAGWGCCGGAGDAGRFAVEPG